MSPDDEIRTVSDFCYLYNYQYVPRIIQGFHCYGETPSRPSPSILCTNLNGISGAEAKKIERYEMVKRHRLALEDMSNINTTKEEEQDKEQEVYTREEYKLFL